MPVEVILPKVDMDMTHARIVQWHVREGTVVARGDVLFDMETDKSVMEVEASAAGTIGRITGPTDEPVAIGEVVAWILAEDEDADSLPEPASVSDDGSEKRSDTASPPDVSPTDSQPSGEQSVATGTAEAGTAVRATPYARRLAAEQGIDLRTINGSGARGRVEARDLTTPQGAHSHSAGTTALADDVRDMRVLDDMAYLDTGPGDGEPWLLIHGFGGDHATFAALAHALTRAGKRVIVPELPGHGRTRLEADTPEALGTAVVHLIEKLRLSRPCRVVAHSLGALPAIALALAPAKVPMVGSLTLIAPAGIGLHIDREFVQGMARPGSAGELMHLLDRLSATSRTLGHRARQALFEQLRAGRLQALGDALTGRVGQGISILSDLEILCERLPVRVLVGAQDQIIDWHDACRLTPRIAVHHFPNAGHMPHWEQPREVLAILLAGDSPAA